MNGRGYVKTPVKIVEHMVAKLFENRPPKPTDRVLDAGCGQGEFIEAMILWCKKTTIQFPKLGKAHEWDKKADYRMVEKFELSFLNKGSNGTT